DLVAELNLQTGAVNVIGVYSDPAIIMHGLEWDTSTTPLYGMSFHNNGLYQIDTTTGATTLIGPTRLMEFPNLGYDSNANVMYVTSSGNDSLYTINPGTAVVTLVGPLG